MEQPKEQPKAAMAAIDPLETLSNAIDGIESRYAVHGSFAMMFGRRADAPQGPTRAQ